MTDRTFATAEEIELHEWFQSNGYRDIDDWAEDSDFYWDHDLEVWRREHDDAVVDILQAAWDAYEASGERPRPTAPKRNAYIVSVLLQVAGTDEEDALLSVDRILLRIGLRPEDEPARRLAELGLLYVNAPEEAEPAPYSLDEWGSPVAEDVTNPTTS